MKYITNKIGYRISFKELTCQQIRIMLEQYIQLFGYSCEFKLSERMLENGGIDRLKFIRKEFEHLNFSIHLPKDFFYPEKNDKSYIQQVLFQLSQMVGKHDLVCISHFPEKISEILKMIEEYKQISYIISNNIIILFENPVIRYKKLQYFDFINEFFSVLDKNYKNQIGMCLDVGHLLYSFRDDPITESEIYTKFISYKNILQNVHEVHLHDYDCMCDHKTLGSGLLDFDLLRQFINENLSNCPIIIESTVKAPKDDGVKQIKLLTNLKRKNEMEFLIVDKVEDILELHKKIFNFDFPLASYYKKKNINDLLIYLYKMENQYVGYSIIVNQSEKKNFYAWYGGVIPEYQGRGINSLFLDELIREAKRRNYDSITLATTNVRPHMIILAVKKGFQIYDLKKRDYGEGNKIYFKYSIR